MYNNLDFQKHFPVFKSQIDANKIYKESSRAFVNWFNLLVITV